MRRYFSAAGYTALLIARQPCRLLDQSAQQMKGFLSELLALSSDLDNALNLFPLNTKWPHWVVEEGGAGAGVGEGGGGVVVIWPGDLLR